MKLICPMCQLEFNAPHSKRKFCSRKCVNEHQSIHLKGSNHPMFGKKQSEEAKKKMSVAKKTGFIKECEVCKKEIWATSIDKRLGRKRFCSKKCYGVYRTAHIEEFPHKVVPAWNKGLKYIGGKDHWNWRGGKRKHPAGYIEIHIPDHPFSRHGGYVYEHRLVMEKKLNRLLTPIEQVHHRNEIKNDNHPDNLMLFENNSAHKKYHGSMEHKEFMRIFKLQNLSPLNIP